ncbi:hypothetical protein CsSME_00005309 [Camellia sinensis var. sinensis]
MVIGVKSHHEDEEEDDEELVRRTTDGCSQKVKVDGKTTDQKANSLRSKHSETEQRRRSKINERFQTLRDLIPQNDQRRDKASFLLEVIQYIQFLQEKLQLYEGPYQSWGQEPSKLIPWRNSGGPVESFIDQSELTRNGSGQEDNIVVTPSMLTNAHNSVESVLEVAAYKSQSQFWQSRPCTTESAVPSYTHEQEMKFESDEANISNAYSQGLLNTLTRALQSSGVDLSQASISVQLDVGKRANTALTATLFSVKDHQNRIPGGQSRAVYGFGTRCDDCTQAPKRLRTERI